LLLIDTEDQTAYFTSKLQHDIKGRIFDKYLHYNLQNSKNWFRWQLIINRFCKTGKLELVDVISDQCLLKTRRPCLNNKHTHTHLQRKLTQDGFNVNVIIFVKCLISFW